MFYSATQSLMIVQAQAAERANFGPGLSATQVDRQRRTQSQEINGTTSATAPARAVLAPTQSKCRRKGVEQVLTPTGGL